ncbi:hypothetical protein JCM8097_006726 [Rhodosporidiobolus ruineniae]
MAQPSKPHPPKPSPPSTATPATLTPSEHHQLSTVVRSLAPPTVLDQHLSLPDFASQTLRHVFDPAAAPSPSLTIPILRAALNEATTSALLSSTMMVFDSASNGEASARLMNEIDDFQGTVLGVLDQLERGKTEAAKGAERGVKREADEDDASLPPAKTRKYMLHRSLATGVDLFTSAAILSDADLAELSSVEDTDLIAVLPPLPSSSSSSTSLPSVPPPHLKEVNPRPSPFLVSPALRAPALTRFGMAPGQVAKARLAAAAASSLPSSGSPAFVKEEEEEEAEEEPEEPREDGPQPVQFLAYSPFSSFAPSYDSRDATMGYHASAQDALRRKRAGRWERLAKEAEALPALPAPSLATAEEGDAQLALSAAEQATLEELGVELDAFLAGARSAAAELRVWAVLERNGRLIERVAGRQRARIRSAGRREGRKAEVKSEEEGEGERVEGPEKEEAAALLASLSSLIALSSSPSPSPASPSSRLFPPAALLRTLTPLLLAHLPSAREPSFYGTLDEVNSRAVREGQVGSGAAGAGVGMQV